MKFTIIDSTSFRKAYFDTDDCSGETLFYSTLINECDTVSDVSWINTPLTANDLIPDVNCTCDFDEFIKSDSEAGNETGALPSKNETADDESPVTSGSEHMTEHTAKIMAMLAVSLSAIMM